MKTYFKPLAMVGLFFNVLVALYNPVCAMQLEPGTYVLDKTVADVFQSAAKSFVPKQHHTRAHNMIADFEASFLPENKPQGKTFRCNFFEEKGFVAFASHAGEALKDELSCLCFVYPKDQGVDALESAENVAKPAASSAPKKPAEVVFEGICFRKQQVLGKKDQLLVKVMRIKGAQPWSEAFLKTLFETQTFWRVENKT